MFLSLLRFFTRMDHESICIQEYSGTSELKLEGTNISLNLTSSVVQLMNIGVPWRGAHKKDSISMQILFEALLKCRVVVLNAYASTSDDRALRQFICNTIHISYMCIKKKVHFNRY